MRPVLSYFQFKKFRFPKLVTYILSISALTMLIRVGGFFEKMALANFFGTGASLDAYIVAMQLPMMFYFTISALISPALFPIFVKYYRSGKSGEALGQATVWGLIFIGFLLIFIPASLFFTDPLVGILAPGFDDETAKTCASLMRILLPLSILLAILPMSNAMLNAQRIFTIPPIAEFIMKCTFLAGIVLFSTSLGIYGVAYAMCAATFIWLTINGAILWFKGRREESVWAFSRPDFKVAFFLMLAPCFGKLVSQISAIAENAICSGIQPGAITALSLSKKIVDLPLLAISLATGTVLYTYFSEYSSKGDMESLTRLLANGLRVMLLIFLPLAILTSILAEPIIAFVYQRGEFDQESTALVSTVLFWLAPSMVLYSIEMLLMRHYFSRQDVWTPILIGVLCVAVRLTLMLALISAWGIVAIAIAIVLSRLLKVLLLLGLAYKKQVITFQSLVCSEWLKLVPATLAAGIVALMISHGLQEVLPDSLFGRLAHLSLAGGGGILTYLFTLFLVRSRDSILFLQWIRSR